MDSELSTAATSVERAVPSAGTILVRFAALSVIAASTVGSLSAFHPLCDLCSHFRAQYFVLLAGLAVLLWCCRSRILTSVALLALIHNGVLIGPYYWTAIPTISPGQPALSIVSFNVLTSNRKHAEVLEYLRQKNPDVILLIEVDNRWLRELAALNDDYPHSVIAPTEGAEGIALFSKLPIRDHRLLGLGTDLFPSIWAELDFHGQRIAFLGTHPPPPVLPRFYDIRNRQLAVLAEQVRSSGLPTIVAGDLNSTPWCSGFERLLADGNLTDTSLGRGLQRTWNSGIPLMRIPIDHVLTTREFTSTRRAVGPHCGSDHYAVEAELSLK